MPSNVRLTSSNLQNIVSTFSIWNANSELKIKQVSNFWSNINSGSKWKCLFLNLSLILSYIGHIILHLIVLPFHSMRLKRRYIHKTWYMIYIVYVPGHIMGEMRHGLKPSDKKIFHSSYCGHMTHTMVV